MPVTETTTALDTMQRRHPRVLAVISWLRTHPVFCGVAGTIGVAAVFFMDMSVPGVLINGVYFLPIFFLALTVSWRAVAFAVAVCTALSAFVFVWEGSIDLDRWLILLYSLVIGGAMVLLAYLIMRLFTTTEYAVLRAQLSEAGADILSSGRSRDDLDELLEYALERLGEQLDATNGLLLLLERGDWAGRAGFGLGLDARKVTARHADLPLAAQALAADAAVMRDFTSADPSPLAPLAAHMRLERVLVLPMRSLDREIGVLVYNRPQDAGEYSGEQVGLAEGLARYIGVTVDNVRLMYELDTRRRDLELVRDSSLDFAQSIDKGEVLEAVTMRLIDALDMHACDIYEVDVAGGVMRNLVSYDDGDFDQGQWLGREYVIDHFATSAMAIRSRRPVVIASREDPRLNDLERELMQRSGHNTQLIIPLRIREHVIALVDLLDDRQGRDIGDEEIELARSICRFAALAIDKARLFDEQRATAERRDRLARRLQRLQSFAVGLNQRLDRADLQEVLDEVTRAAVDLLHVRSAAVMTSGGDYVAVRSLAVAGAPTPGALAATEADLRERCHPRMTESGEHFAGAGSFTVTR
jgi:GAF domain-containing protein